MICCEGFGIEMTDESCGRCPRVLYAQRLFGEMAAGLVHLVLCLVSDAQEPPYQEGVEVSMEGMGKWHKFEHICNIVLP